MKTTPETKEIHCLCCKQKQLKGKTGLLQICMHLKQRPMSYSNVQQSMVQELHK